MNRKTRRASRMNPAAAREAAAKLAADCMNYSDGGHMVRIAAPLAQAALTRAFAKMLRTMQPATLVLTADEARAFPVWDEADAGMASVLAVWFDAGGHAAYTVRHATAVNILTGAVDPQAAVRTATYEALTSLAEIVSYTGFPTIHQPEGRA